jgi:hypothetical protein
MISLILVLGLMVLLIFFTVRWAVREDRRRKLASVDDTKEGLNA